MGYKKLSKEFVEQNAKAGESWEEAFRRLGKEESAKDAERKPTAKDTTDNKPEKYFQLEQYKEAYKKMLDLRKEFKSKEGYIRTKTPEEKAYHNAKSAFGEFKPDNQEFMQSNDNQGKGVDIKLPDGKTTHIANQKELFDKVVEFNKTNGKFYDEKHIAENNPDDLKRLRDIDEKLKSSRKTYLEDNQSPDRFKVLESAEMDVKNNIQLKPTNATKSQKQSTDKKPKNEAKPKQEETKKANKKTNQDEIEVDKYSDKNNDEIPSHLSKTFLIAGDHSKAKYFYKQKPDVEAFNDSGKKIVTKLSSAVVAKAMVEVAEAKNWESLKVKGEKAFKAQIWLEASLKGIAVKGYKPNEKDLALLESKQADVTNSIEEEKEQAKETLTDVEKTTQENLDTNVKSADAKIIEIRDKIMADEKAGKPENKYRDAYMNLSKAEAIKSYPELKELYNLEKAADQFVNTGKNKNHLTAENKQLFIEGVRDKGLDAINNGQEIKAIPTKERATTPEKEIER